MATLLQGVAVTYGNRQVTIEPYMRKEGQKWAVAEAVVPNTV